MSKLIRREKKEWMKIIAECEQSGKSVAAFCKQKGVGEASFYKWRKRIGTDTSARITTPMENEPFIEMGPIASVAQADDAGDTPWQIALELGDGIKLTLRRG